MNCEQTIQQLGGIGPLRAMVGANNFIRRGENSMSFRFKGSRRMNYFQITLNAMDTYDLEFGQIRKAGYVERKNLEGIYADQLIETFEETTGLHLRF